MSSKKAQLPEIKTREGGKKKPLFSNLSDPADFIVNRDLSATETQIPSNIEPASPPQPLNPEKADSSEIKTGEHSPDIITNVGGLLGGEEPPVQTPLSKVSLGSKEVDDAQRDEVKNRLSPGVIQVEESYLPDSSRRGRRPGEVSRKEQIKIYENKRAQSLRKIGPRLPVEKVRILKGYCANKNVDLEDVVEEALDLWSTGRVKDPETGEFVNWWEERVSAGSENTR